MDYEPALFKTPGDPYPHLDLAKVRADRIIDKPHRAIVMENEYIRLTLLPDMGRLYSLVYKPTGHEVFWRNDIVTVGAASNEPGWWIWIGGAEFTLPGDEHGTTWAEPWTSAVLDAGAAEKPSACLLSNPRRAFARRSISRSRRDTPGSRPASASRTPRTKSASYAHWINPMWTPGGWNELTDGTELIIPTDQIIIPGKYQAALGPSPQRWATSPLRFIKGWDKGMGDLMADGLREGFFGAYSHDEEEGVVRIFDKALNPGLDVWTYGYHPRPPHHIPMGSGAPSRGYAEMWGGTSKTFPDEERPLAPGETIEWTEWMMPFQLTGGLTTADRDFAIRCVRGVGAGKPDGRSRTEADRAVAERGRLLICPAREFGGLTLRLISGDRVLWETHTAMSPDRPFSAEIDGLGAARPLTLIIESGGRILLKKDLSSGACG